MTADDLAELETELGSILVHVSSHRIITAKCHQQQSLTSATETLANPSTSSSAALLENTESE